MKSFLTKALWRIILLVELFIMLVMLPAQASAVELSGIEPLVLTENNVIANAIGSGTCGENLTWFLDDAGTLTISGTGSMADYTSLPSASLTDSSSTAPWYPDRALIKAVILTDGVTSVGNHAFSGCNSLESVLLPDGVLTIGWDAFAYCYNLKDVSIPNSVISIAYQAFLNCSSLVSIEIPSSVETIGGHAFEYCSNLKEITIPDSVVSITSDIINSTAYYNNDSNWENGVLYIGHWLVTAKKLVGANYNIKNGTVGIASSAFGYYCKELTKVSMPDSVAYIGDSAFFGCESLHDVSLSNKLVSIGYGAFRECSDLEDIVIPGGVTVVEHKTGFVKGFFCKRIRIYTLFMKIPPRNAWVAISTVLFCQHYFSSTGIHTS